MYFLSGQSDPVVRKDKPRSVLRFPAIGDPNLPRPEIRLRCLSRLDGIYRILQKLPQKYVLAGIKIFAEQADDPPQIHLKAVIFRFVRIFVISHNNLLPFRFYPCGALIFYRYHGQNAVSNTLKEHFTFSGKLYRLFLNIILCIPVNFKQNNGFLRSTR